MDERTEAYATARVLEPDFEVAEGEGESVEGEWGGKRRKDPGLVTRLREGGRAGQDQ